MPTNLPRHQVTETPEVARALDLAARRWPHETRGKLLVHLVKVGSRVLEGRCSEETQHRVAAVDATSGKYADVFTDNYLADLRRDWPE